jgi:EAL domain-containing protein (putative c-di-GMP-specific phosphodiesterase class I)
LDARSELQLALERHQLLLYYQPIVDVRTEAIVSVEALLRWQHPVRGLLAPIEFVPLAEETGLILPIGMWVLEEACRQEQHWRSILKGRAPLIAVNVSGRQFQQVDFVDQVARVLRDAELEAASLEIEITESVMINDAEIAAQTVLRLKQLGVRLAIDDFGVGYSSLSYLHSFDVHTLKVDQSFIDPGTAGAGNWTVVEAIVGLAHALKMTAVAEGVENEEQVLRLKALGCDRAQGYFFHRPMPRQEIDLLLLSKSP